MTAILAIDTSADACSVALWQEGELTTEYAVAPREHTRRILVMVDRVLSTARVKLVQLDAIAFGRGPGSFTGLRIAAGVTQGLAFGANLPVVPVSSLAALAQGWVREHAPTQPLSFWVAVDARMEEVYFAAYHYDGNTLALLGTEQVIAPLKLVLPEDQRPKVALGSGWQFGADVAGFNADRCLAVDVERQVNAADVALLARHELLAGRSCSAAQAQPVYLRNEISWKKANIL